MESKYEYLADGISGQFLRLWALASHENDVEFIDDLFSFCAFDGI